MTAQLAPALIFQGITATGAPLVAGQLFSFAAGTNTPQATYVDSTQTTQNPNPTILNSFGQASIWLDPTKAYKFALQDAAGNPLYTVDNIIGPLSLPNLVVGPPPTGVALRVNGSLDGATAFLVTASVAGVQPVAAITNGFTTPGQSFGLLITAGTNSSDYALRVSNAALTTAMFQVGGAGNVTIAPPTSGDSLTISVIPSTNAINVTNPGAVGYTALNFLNSAGQGFIGMTNLGTIQFGTLTTSSVLFYSNGVPRMQINSAGAVSIIAPTLGTSLTVAASSGGSAAISVAPGTTDGTFLSTNPALANAAAAATGTLTNAPAAGNPTKWIKINDGGVIRAIPAW